LKVYVEDFRMETDERKKLHNENLNLKKELSKTTEDREHLKNQLKVYEEDFATERNKRIQLMKMQQMQNQSDVQMQYQQREYQEYCQLMQEKERINSRIKDLEFHQGGNGGGGLPQGRSNSVSSTSRPNKFHAPLTQQYSGPSSLQHYPQQSKYLDYQQQPSNNYQTPQPSPLAFNNQNNGQQTSPTYSMMSKLPNASPNHNDRYSSPTSTNPFSQSANQNSQFSPPSNQNDHFSTSSNQNSRFQQSSNQSDRYQRYNNPIGGGEKSFYHNNQLRDEEKMWMPPSPNFNSSENGSKRAPSESSYRLPR